MRRIRGWLLSTMLVLSIVAAGLTPASTLAASSTDAFQTTWTRHDDPVARGSVSRTWMWGPGTQSPLILERYAEARGGQRWVQYYDKSRMEINDQEPRTSLWYVTNGLLAQELVTGKMKLGDLTYEQFGPAEINVAGDGDDPNGPTYASFNRLLGYGAVPSGWLITQTVDRAGNVGNDEGLARFGVVAQDVGAPTQHSVASVFWDFMTSSGVVSEKGRDVIAPLFLNAFYATGYPLTEPYWTTVRVGGTSKQVLVQVFERRVLTYTPDNPEGWKVEAGNVGQHYYRWRYHAELPTTNTVIGAVDMAPGVVDFYGFGGVTPDEVAEQLTDYAPSSRYIAEIRWVYKWTGDKIKNPDGTCYIQNAAVSYEIEYTHPLWEQPAGASPQLLARWDAFSTELARQQKAQGDLVAANAYRIVDAANGTACTKASKAVSDATKEVKQLLVDYDTEHDLPAFP